MAWDLFYGRAYDDPNTWGGNLWERLMAGYKATGTGKTATKPGTAPKQPQTVNWTFPQYSQTWAFTPPTPTPYQLPPPNPYQTSSKK